MADIKVDLAGVDDVLKELRVTEREIPKILRAAANKTGQRMRTVERQTLRRRGVSREGIKVRGRGRRGQAWIGANDVPAAALPGVVIVNDDAERPQVFVNGEDVHAFRLNLGERQPLVFRHEGRLVSVKTGHYLPFEDIASEAHDNAADEGEEYFLQETHRQAVKELTGVLPA